jgi:hypothetical protein
MNPEEDLASLALKAHSRVRVALNLVVNASQFVVMELIAHQDLFLA